MLVRRKKNLTQNCLAPKILGRNKFFALKMLCPKTFGSKRILNPKCFGSKKSRGKKYRSKIIRAHKNCFIKIKLVTAEIFMIWTNVARKNVT